jgi:hypothetical protein
MFADLCNPTAEENFAFQLVCVAVGISIALLVRWWSVRSGRQSLEHANAGGCAAIIGFVLVLIVIPMWFVSVIFPDPNDDPNGGCGFTSDSIFLPIEAAVALPAAFVATYMLLIAISAARSRDK